MVTYTRVYTFTSVLEVESAACANQLAHNLIGAGYWFCCAPVGTSGARPLFAFEFVCHQKVDPRVFHKLPPAFVRREPSLFTVAPPKSRRPDPAVGLTAEQPE